MGASRWAITGARRTMPPGSAYRGGRVAIRLVRTVESPRADRKPQTAARGTEMKQTTKDTGVGVKGAQAGAEGSGEGFRGPLWALGSQGEGSGGAPSDGPQIGRYVVHTTDGAQHDASAVYVDGTGVTMTVSDRLVTFVPMWRVWGIDQHVV